MVYVLALRVAFWNAERKGHQLRSDLEQGQKAVFLLVLLLVHKIVITKIILSGEMSRFLLIVATECPNDTGRTELTSPFRAQLYLSNYFSLVWKFIVWRAVRIHICELPLSVRR